MTDNEPFTSSERAVVSDESSSAQLDHPVTVHRDRRAIVDLAAVTQHQARVGIEEQAATTADQNLPPDLDARMKYPPDTRPGAPFDPAEPGVDAVKAHPYSA